MKNYSVNVQTKSKVKDEDNVTWTHSYGPLRVYSIRNTVGLCIDMVEAQYPNERIVLIEARESEL